MEVEASTSHGRRAILGGLAVNGKLMILGAATEPVQAPGIPLLLGRRSIVGWPSGSSIDSQDTLNLSLHRCAGHERDLSAHAALHKPLPIAPLLAPCQLRAAPSSPVCDF